MAGQRDWTWKKLVDTLSLRADLDPASAVKEAVEDVLRRINVQMKLLENGLSATARTINAVDSFANGATTPNISQAAVWKTANTGVTVITNFMGGESGRVPFTLVAGDANTTIQNNANIVTKTGANRVLALGNVTQFVTTDGAVWREVPTP